jgi:hypothetical protein
MNSTPIFKQRIKIAKSLSPNDIIQIKGEDLDHVGNIKVVRVEPKTRALPDGTTEEDVVIYITKSYQRQVIHPTYIYARAVDIVVVARGSEITRQEGFGNSLEEQVLSMSRLLSFYFQTYEYNLPSRF